MKAHRLVAFGYIAYITLRPPLPSLCGFKGPCLASFIILLIKKMELLRVQATGITSFFFLYIKFKKSKIEMDIFFYIPIREMCGRGLERALACQLRCWHAPPAR